MDPPYPGNKESKPRREGIMKMNKGWGAALLLALWGCAATLVGAGAGAGVGTYSYIKGELNVTYAKEYREVVSATEKTVRNLGFSLQGETKDKLMCRIKAKMADGTVVKLYVDRASEKITQLRIKVGLFGNKDVSLQIMRAIEKKMGVAPASSTS